MKTSKNRGTYYSPFTIMADERTEKQKVQEITDKLEEGLKELFESEKYKTYLSTMSPVWIFLLSVDER